MDAVGVLPTTEGEIVVFRAQSHAFAFVLSTLATVSVLTNLAEAVVFDFDRILWDDGLGGTHPDESWGEVNVSLDPNDAGLFFPSPSAITPGFVGYLNVVTDTLASGGVANNWAVQNAPIHFYDVAELTDGLTDSYQFNLGVSSGVTSLDFIATIDETPLATQPGSGAFSGTGVGVTPVNELIGGEAYYLRQELREGTTASSGPPVPSNFVGLSSGSSIGAKGTSGVELKDVEKVNESSKGCAPAAVARSLKALAKMHSHVNITDSAQDVYDTLRDPNHMDTKLGGTGTKTENIKKGKDKYVRDNKLPIITTTVDHKGFDKAIKTLNNKGDVEIGFDNSGKHRAFVLKIQQTLDSLGKVNGYEVTYVDDKRQGDGVKSNNARKKVFRLDGSSTSGGRLINLLLQDVKPAQKNHTYSSSNVQPNSATSETDSLIPSQSPGVFSLDLNAPLPNEIEFQSGPAGNPNTFDVDIVGESGFSLDPGDFYAFDLHIENQDLAGSTAGELREFWSDPNDLFLTNFSVDTTFFDITWQLDLPSSHEDVYQVFQLHGEIDPLLHGSLWFDGTQSIATPTLDSAFDLDISLEYDDLAAATLDLSGVTVVSLSVQSFQVAPGDLAFTSDFDFDGTVNAGDFLEWQRGAGTLYDSGNLADWEANYGTPTTANTAAVPEPGTFALVLTTFAVGLGRHRR